MIGIKTKGTAPTEWTWAPPTEPGEYWFYGRAWGDEERKLYLAHVVKTSNSLAFIIEANFFYPRQDGMGAWAKAELPAPPKENHVDD